MVGYLTSMISGETSHDRTDCCCCDIGEPIFDSVMKEVALDPTATFYRIVLLPTHELHTCLSVFSGTSLLTRISSRQGAWNIFPDTECLIVSDATSTHSKTTRTDNICHLNQSSRIAE